MSERIPELLRTRPQIVNLGLELFARAVREQGGQVHTVEWHPPLVEPSAGAIALFSDPEIEGANREAVSRMMGAQPVVVGVARACEVIPGMTERTFLHAGPPIDWAHASGPLRGALIGAALLEGLASTPEGAVRLLASGGIELAPNHEHQAVGPMAGVISPSMPVYIAVNATGSNRAFTNFNEGIGKVMRMGAYAPEVIERQRWIGEVLAPLVGQALARSGGIDLRAIIAQALQMGDECHNRNKAATSLLYRALAPNLVECDAPANDIAQVLRFIDSNDHFFVNLAMVAAKVMADAAHGVAGSSLVTTLSRNGTEFGIRVSGLGDQWFTGPANVPHGLYFPGFGPDDANPDIGDSAITETAGFGGFALAGAPAIVQFIGGSPADALRATLEMYEITVTEHEVFRLPVLDFRGTPVGIDLRAVVRTGILPVIDTGIAHREPGIGQVGAGIVRPPARCFTEAYRAFERAYLAGLAGRSVEGEAAR
jgi:hypothetical protein